jgi:hypothetical protein
MSDYVVVAPTFSGKLSFMKEGSLSECRKYIRDRMRSNQPTHFCYVIRNTDRAINNFKKRHKIES